MTGSAKNSAPLTGREVHFADDELIVSKTDTGGRITYANRTFLRVAGYDEEEILGQPHNCIRHPQMPRIIFKTLWDHLVAGKEIFAYVLNRTKVGDHYWVFAHVTPSRDIGGTITGYHSSRRTADTRTVAETITPLYAALLAEEAKHDRARTAMEASGALLMRTLRERGQDYEQFIFSL